MFAEIDDSPCAYQWQLHPLGMVATSKISLKFRRLIDVWIFGEGHVPLLPGCNQPQHHRSNGSILYYPPLAPQSCQSILDFVYTFNIRAYFTLSGNSKNICTCLHLRILPISGAGMSFSGARHFLIRLLRN